MSINPRTMSFVTSDALRALCLSFVLASFTDPGVMSLVAWTGAGTAWAENFVWTGSVAFERFVRELHQFGYGTVRGQGLDRRSGCQVRAAFNAEAGFNAHMPASSSQQVHALMSLLPKDKQFRTKAFPQTNCATHDGTLILQWQPVLSNEQVPFKAVNRFIKQYDFNKQTK